MTYKSPIDTLFDKLSVLERRVIDLEQEVLELRSHRVIKAATNRYVGDSDNGI